VEDAAADTPKTQDPEQAYVCPTKGGGLMAMIVRGEERYCAFCYVNKKIKVDAYVSMKYRFNESWWDLCEEHFAEHPTRSVDDDDVVLLINEGAQ
jgi:hypothetical protein